MSDAELLIAISDMLDKKLKPLNERQKRIEITLENDVLPRLQNIEACYTGTYKRYEADSEKMESMQMDMELVKKVIQEHTKRLSQFA